MTVLHIMAGKGNGGAETYSTDVMLGLHRAGVPQIVVMRAAAPRADELKAAGLRVVSDVFDSRFHLGQRRRLARLLGAERPDIVQCWMRRAASLVPSAWGRTSPLIGWFGDYEELKHFAHCSHLVGCTQAIVDHMLAGGVPADRATYIPTFPTIDDAPAADRAALETPADARVLLTLSRLDPVKGLDTMLEALARLPGVHLWMTGEGPSRADLERITRRLGLADRVHFLGWRTDRGALLRAADVCVLPSRYEPFGTVILEAWRTKTPLVACAAAGPEAHVRHRLNGMMVGIDDAAGLATAIAEVLADADLRGRLVEGGYADYEARFTEAAVMADWQTLYGHVQAFGRAAEARSPR